MNPEVVTVSSFDKPAHGGACITRLEDGRIAFVTGAVMGDRDVEVALDPAAKSSSKRSFRTGQVVRVGSPSAHRVLGQCGAAAAGAGCCDLDFIDAPGSLEFKKAVVVDQFERIGKIKLADDVVFTHSLEPYVGWRTRARVAIDAQGTVGIRKKNSHEVVPLTPDTLCAQWVSEMKDGLCEQISDLAAEGRIRPRTELIIAVGSDGVRSIVELSGNRRHRKTTALVGDGSITQQLGGLTWDLPAQAFWQGHHAATEFYAQWIERSVPSALEQRSTAWDLYGGAGSLSSALVDKADRVVSVDIAGDATSAGSRAFSQAKAHSVEFWDSNVDRVAERVVASDKKTNRRVPAWWSDRHAQEYLHAVVLDPPRTGAGKHTIPAVASRQPKHVVHVGCDPAAAARDVRRWIDAGYAISQVAIVDAFGLTHHVEVLVHLQPVATA
ncbi:class I SAM-dependent RNA methyltransferase [Corynebacterium auriscanis]|uniref:class I SAM-dependent RNA methyltransferase n=1 Tax=Corynebacterium auriscanis TaxID=99807 RepID=UPI003CF99152